MAYYYDVRSSGHPITIRNSSGMGLGSVPSIVSAVYSFRSNRKPAGVLALGELRQNPQLDSVTNYLAAEQTAIRELNSELESSSVLDEGTWGTRDAGHVFSSVRQSRKGLHHSITFPRNSVPNVNSSDCVWLTPSVDSITAEIMYPYRDTRDAVEQPWLLLSNAGNYLQSYTLKQASGLLWQTDPDIIHGSIGQDLVDLAQLPKLLTHLKGLATALDSLKSKWGRLDREVQEAVDLLFKKNPSPRARQRGLKKLRSLSRRSLSKGSAAYLEWAFVLSPYIDDLQLMLRVLGHLSGALVASSRRSRRSHEYRLEGKYSGEVIIPRRNSSIPGNFSRGSTLWPDEPHCWSMSRSDIYIHAKWALKGATLNPFVQKAVNLNRQLGVIYPSLLWDLAPWTFLIDWFLHIGTSIDRATYLSKGQYTPVYAWATVKGFSGVGWEAPPSKFWSGETLSAPWPGMPVTSWTTRFPVSLNDGLKPQWTSLPGSARGVLAALGFSRLK